MYVCVHVSCVPTFSYAMKQCTCTHTPEEHSFTSSVIPHRNKTDQDDIHQRILLHVVVNTPQLGIVSKRLLTMYSSVTIVVVLLFRVNS